ncbi:cytochrome c3 family protein [Candidatus Manganitrophus noduliformans]|uniref:Cytochrome c3 family protein n=1 Tax=Candidatus Manganitrophus noduliformans TaxID=2606439 RepID=A0A7X6DNT7_9BACT|nr:cytochrome c3 family protein [Candidatus Manganitrophus noduliformans]NKE70517.1 cytochrome c3 family protein [Candidatus Manganitrophus noduliformans]
MRGKFRSSIGVWGLSIVLLITLGTVALSLLGIPFRSPSSAQPTSEPFNEDVSNTKHNLSANPVPNPTLFQELFDPDMERNVKSVDGPQGTTEVCVFCHTPHGASQEGVKIRAPIWNRNLSPAHYQMYDQVWSKSFEAKPNDPGRPTGYSRLCLSCHDGTIALGSLINKPGSGGFDPDGRNPIEMEYPTGQTPAGPPGSIPVGDGATQQATRVLGRDLRNDHPISMRFDTELLSKDHEFVDPGPPIRRPFTQSTPTPLSPLRRATGNSVDVFDSVQCTSCHNPHQVDFPKFLRANRLQSLTFATTQAAKHPGLPGTSAPPQGGGAIICLFCHDKPGWPYNEADLNSHFGDRQTGQFDDSRLKPGATNLHNSETPVVAERACLICHDPHTRQGAVRIMREGVDHFGNVAIEQTCFQCHQPQETSILQAPTRAPDIMTQFFKDREGNGSHGVSPTGSAMDLNLALGHQPVFVDLPTEGVQLGSDNRLPSFFGGPFSEPPNNKILTENAPPTPDTSHVECVDCHNMHRVTRRNRFEGMPGITIRSGIVASTLKSVDERREPYIYEVCLRCHGNTFNNHVREALFTAVGTGKVVQARGNSPVNPALGVNAHGSNKRKEFDPTSVPFYPENFRIQNPADPNGPLVPDPNPPRFNHSFHPVFQPGRNQSGVLNNYTLNMSTPTQQGQFLGRMGLSREKTIHCTDCHNTDLFGTYLGGALPLNRVFGAFGFPTLTSCWDGSQNVSCPDYPGPITFDDTRGTAYRRPTDVPPDIPVNPEATRTASLNDPNTAQGPHGSIYKRILRANYDTKVGTAEQKLCGDVLVVGTCPGGNGKATYNPQNFALCFNCHAEAAFITPAWTDSGPGVENCSKDASGAFIPPKARLTNFYRCETGNVDGQTSGGNLHMLHLVGRTNARCHECHNNVHSNVEAGNTIYVGLNNSNFVANNPGHNLDTHLINFQPNIRGNRSGEGAFDIRGEDHVMWGDGEVVNPTDFSFGHKGPGCNLRCHGFSMDHNTDAHSVINGQK